MHDVVGEALYLVQVALDVPQVECLDLCEGLWAHELASLITESDLELPHGLIVDKVTELVLVEAKIGGTALVQAVEERLSLLPGE